MTSSQESIAPREPVCQVFAIIPAAGHSRRMGEDKLLLPWRGSPLIAHTLHAWTRSRVDRIIVVTRSTAQRLIDLLDDFKASIDCVVCQPAPTDMKDSIQRGLSHARVAYAASESDAWLLAPADMPRLDAATIDGVLAEYDPHRPRVIVPTFAGKRGHPVLFPMSMAHRVFELGPDQGVNQIVRAADSVEIPLPNVDSQIDVDTPEDWQNLADPS